MAPGLWVGKGRNNGRTLFGVQRLPSDNHIRSQLDTVDPQLLRPVFQQTSEYLVNEKTFRSIRNTLLVALDGTGYFSSEKLHCDQCSVAHHSDGRTVYSHSVLLAAVAVPKQPQGIPLQAEFIRPQDGRDRQNNEQHAAQRWLIEVAPRHSHLDVTLLGDALYATQTIIQKTLDADMGYLFTAKGDAHHYLHEEVTSLDKLGEDINSLRTKGYHFEHNFGHDKRFLAATLLSLNLIAFLFHTVLELLEFRCALIRKTLPRQDAVFPQNLLLSCPAGAYLPPREGFPVSTSPSDTLRGIALQNENCCRRPGICEFTKNSFDRQVYV